MYIKACIHIFAFWMIRRDCIGIPWFHCFPFGKCNLKVLKTGQSWCLRFTSIHSMQVLCPYIYASSVLTDVDIRCFSSTLCWAFMQNSNGGKEVCVMICALFLLICAGLKFTGEIPVVPLQFIRSDMRWIKSSGEYAESLANANSVPKE